MPKLWDDTIEAHRHHVTEVILHTTAHLVAERGLRDVTMSEIAEQAGIGRATLYKYFADVESILTEWHERQIHSHLQQLKEIVERDDAPADKLGSILEAYAFILHSSRGHHDSDLGALLHRGGHVSKAEKHLRALLEQLISDAAAEGELRDDIAPSELATFSLHALAAAPQMSKAGVTRLVQMTLDALGGP